MGTNSLLATYRNLIAAGNLPPDDHKPLRFLPYCRTCDKSVEWTSVATILPDKGYGTVTVKCHGETATQALPKRADLKTVAYNQLIGPLEFF